MEFVTRQSLSRGQDVVITLGTSAQALGWGRCPGTALTPWRGRRPFRPSLALPPVTSYPGRFIEEGGVLVNPRVSAPQRTHVSQQQELQRCMRRASKIFNFVFDKRKVIEVIKLGMLPSPREEFSAVFSRGCFLIIPAPTCK